MFVEGIVDMFNSIPLIIVDVVFALDRRDRQRCLRGLNLMNILPANTVSIPSGFRILTDL